VASAIKLELIIFGILFYAYNSTATVCGLALITGEEFSIVGGGIYAATYKLSNIFVSCGRKTKDTNKEALGDKHSNNFNSFYNL